MVFIISAMLCLALVIAICGVLFPETVLPFLAKIWDRDSFYIK